MRIPVIDLFAGPGGLGEGFAALKDVRGNALFHIRLSIEKDIAAHRTLQLRAFFRQFNSGDVPPEYYRHLRGEITYDEVFAAFPAEMRESRKEAWHAELGLTPELHVRERINQALHGEKDWVLIGGPPCQAYSLAGRSRNRAVSGYLPTKDVRQTLYLEYLKVIADHWPAVFVMENVPGLLSAQLEGKGVLDRILNDLHSPASALGRSGRSANVRGGPYNYELWPIAGSGSLFQSDPQDYLVKAERYGVPQARHRVILFGVRDDISVTGRINALTPKPSVPVSAVLEGLPRVRSGLSRGEDSPENWIGALRAAKERQWLRSARTVAGREVYERIVETLEGLTIPKKDRGAEFIQATAATRLSKKWFSDPQLKGVCNHRAKDHMIGDLHRYLYATCYATVHKKSPTLQQFPRDLLPNHENVSQAHSPRGGIFTDRFRVQTRGRPATTITSHIQKDGHYYIHYDPSQCRSLTVREAARIQTFPDNYLFCGNRTQQYLQVGNAVPPLLANEIAKLVCEVLTGRSQNDRPPIEEAS